jgi:hypothetical protein
MRSSVVAIALTLAGVAALQAQQAQASDTTLPTGTHVRFWSPITHSWLEGTVLRFFPNSGGVCLGLHSDALQGFQSIQRIDTLQVAVNAPPALSKAAPAKLWRNVSLAPLRAREVPGCTS